MAVLILVLSLAGLITAVDIKDVNSTHWAYQSVKELVDKGYLSVYPDNTFRGNEPVDRYTLASVIARVIKEIQSGNANILKDDVETLKKLYEEFERKLGTTTIDLNKINTRVTSLEKGLGINNEEITRFQLDFDNQVRAIFSSLNNTKSNLQDQIKDLSEEIDSIKTEKVSSTAVDVAISNAIQRASTEIEETNKEQEKLKETFNEQLIQLTDDIDQREQILRDEFNDELAVIKLDMDKNLKAEIEALKTDLAMKGQNFDVLATKTDANIDSITSAIQSLDNKYTQELEQSANELNKVKADLGTVITAMENKMSNDFTMLKSQIQSASQESAAEITEFKKELSETFSAYMAESDQKALARDQVAEEKYVAFTGDIEARMTEINTSQNKILEQIDTLKNDFRMASNLNASKEKAIENRFQKLEEDQKSLQESNQARLQALEKNRTIWHMGFGLSLVAIVIAIVGFYK